MMYFPIVICPKGQQHTDCFEHSNRGKGFVVVNTFPLFVAFYHESGFIAYSAISTGLLLEDPFAGNRLALWWQLHKAPHSILLKRRIFFVDGLLPLNLLSTPNCFPVASRVTRLAGCLSHQHSTAWFG